MSQTRRRGTQILQDEIESAIALVRTHNTNITRKLEKVKDMVSRYCEKKEVVPTPYEAAPSATVLSPIAEGNETENSMVNSVPSNASVSSVPSNASVPLSLKSKGPKPWSNFRSLVGKDTQLKVGQTATSQKIASLWDQAKKGSSTNQIAQYLKNQLQVAPSLANKKAPELAKIAANYAKPVLSKRVTRTVGSASGPVVANSRVTQKKSKAPVIGGPINPNTETDDEFWARMGKQANANAARKNEMALQQAENRRKVREELAGRDLAATPLKSRQVPLAANANVNRSSPIPTLVRNPTVVNPTTGKEEELSL